MGLLVASPLRFGSLVSADQGGYNNAGGYDYGGYNNGNQYKQEKFEWPDDVSFDEVSVLPVSCITLVSRLEVAKQSLFRSILC